MKIVLLIYYNRGYNSYIINSKLNKHYKNEDSEDRKVLETKYSQNEISKKNSNVNNILFFSKRSRTNNINERTNFTTPSKNNDHKKSLASLSITKKYDEDE